MRLIDTYPWGPQPPAGWLMSVTEDGQPADSVDDIPTGTDGSGRHAVWYKGGRLHREGGPAFIWSSVRAGHTLYVWWLDGRLYNPNGPSVLVLPTSTPLQPVLEALASQDKDFPYPASMSAEWTTSESEVLRAGGPAIYSPFLRRVEWREPDGVGHYWTGERPVPGPHDSWVDHANNVVRFELRNDEDDAEQEAE